MTESSIIYTHTDEAPLLATYSFLPIIEAYAEKALLSLIFLIPLSGLLLVYGSDDWVGLHIATHIAFFVVVAVHVGLVLLHTVVKRDRHLARML